ncbi:hypothetical protein UFOVP1290_149 [uncultured Caudovirales phage]|uniref:Uncharacterized protein n=1 Tax=uncultured Caudovirales phage TaxID=2100421 RepID=A0A6J5RHZ7_9CAUD|nr:hypothetical protein UFOVP1290_149 [uncultured Caudovirales phage]
MTLRNLHLLRKPTRALRRLLTDGSRLLRQNPTDCLVAQNRPRKVLTVRIGLKVGHDSPEPISRALEKTSVRPPIRLLHESETLDQVLFLALGIDGGLHLARGIVDGCGIRLYCRNTTRARSLACELFRLARKMVVEYHLLNLLESRRRHDGARFPLVQNRLRDIADLTRGQPRLVRGQEPVGTDLASVCLFRLEQKAFRTHGTRLLSSLLSHVHSFRILVRSVVGWERLIRSVEPRRHGTRGKTPPRCKVRRDYHSRWYRESH